MPAAEAEALKAEGNKLVKQENWPAAAKKYKKASAIDPSCAIYWSNLAFCYDKMAALDEYLAAAQKCVDSDPLFAKGWMRLARAHHRVWGYEEERAVLQRGLSLHPQNLALQLELQKIEGIIRMREGYEELIIKASDENPILLYGGFPPNQQEEIMRSNALRSSFFGLKRQHLPPISKKHEDLSKFSENIRPVIQSFYNGDLKIKWHAESAKFTVEGYIPSESVPVIVVTSSAGESCYSHIVLVTMQNTKYDGILTVDQKYSLQLVLIRRFLAAAGCRLGSVLGEDALMKITHKGLAQLCLKKKLYKDLADIRLTVADIALAHQFKGTNTFIAMLAEDLETNTRYIDAANLYTELHKDSVWDGYEGYGLSKPKLYQFAGLAFKRARDFISAEREYVSSLREEGPNWQWTDPPDCVSTTLNNLMICYDDASHEFLCGLRQDQAHERMQRASLMLTALLSCADVITPGSKLFDHASELKRSLKPQFKRKDKSFKAVVRATMAPTIEEYHERLFSCGTLGSGRVTYRSGDREAQALAQEAILKRHKRANKSSAREFSTSKHRGYSDENPGGLMGWVCGGCLEQSYDKNIKQCPCKTIYYCSKDCQGKHWPIHKRTCPNRKRTKESK